MGFSSSGVIFPGFSWYNLNRGAAQNQIPRNGGAFLWRQAYNARRAGAQILKIAMFDECPGATFLSGNTQCTA